MCLGFIGHSEEANQKPINPDEAFIYQSHEK